MDWTLHWSEQKNSDLKARYGLGFETVVVALQEKRIIEDMPHPDQIRFPHQRMLTVLIESYTWCVPYIASEGVMFLKTMYPSRKFHRRYRDQQ